jgi:hypothetical protein
MFAGRGWTALAPYGVDDAVREITMPMTGRMIHGEQAEPRRVQARQEECWIG